jgi:hypothetical protein
LCPDGGTVTVVRHDGLASYRGDVIGIDLNRCALANEADSNNETRSGGLPNQEPTETLERAASNLHRHSRLQKRIWINGEGTGNQTSHPLDLGLHNRYALAAYSQHLYDTRGGQDL